MLNSYQSVYVTVYRWIFKNFGQGKLPQTKSLFNVSFLLIVLLTTVLLAMQFMLKSQLVHLNAGMAVGMLLGTAFFMLVNYMVLLNNKWFKSLNERLGVMGRRNMNLWSVVLLVNVVAVCIFSLVMTR